MPRRFPVLLFAILLSFVLSSILMGCASRTASRTAYPVTTGSHAPIDPANKDKKVRFVVWATHPVIAATLMTMAQQAGHSVLERSQLDQIFKEQEI